MARIEISMPTTPNFASSTFTLNRAVGQTKSPFTGHQKVQEYDFVGWSADLTLPPQLRSTAVNWQAFLARLQGPTHCFMMSDPDAKTPRGTYDASTFLTKARTANTSTTLTFSASNKTITASNTTFGGSYAGDYIFITGATNEENNGTKKIASITSATVVVVAEDLVDETSGTNACKVQSNKKGATGITFEASTNAGTGTVLVGDYLSIGNTFSTYKQYVMVTEVATENGLGGSAKNAYACRIEPKLRADTGEATVIGFASAKGLFYLQGNPVEWSAGRNSLYNISFSVEEVI